MKKSTFFIGAIGLLLVSCQQSQPTIESTGAHIIPNQQPARRFLALPGQEAVAVNTDTDAAFDRQAQAYAAGNTSTTAQTHQVTDPIHDALSTFPGQNTVTQPTTYPGAVMPTQPMYPNAVSPVQPVYPTQPQGAVHITQPNMQQSAPTQANPAPNTSFTPTGKMDYKLQIINATTGRIFVEAQDASGEIYPCGHMSGGTSSTINKTQANPIKGPITVVVRDPDKPDCPEIRRYQVKLPKENYANRTIGISIVPGGIYHASLDGDVYYTSSGVR